MMDSKVKLILVDDHTVDLEIMRLYAQTSQFDFELFRNADEAVDYIGNLGERKWLLLTDISMPMTSGFDLLQTLKKKYDKANVIFVSGHSDLDYPVQALRDGALDYLAKPLDQKVFEARILRAFDMINAFAELERLQGQILSGTCFDGFVGQSPAIREVFQLIRQVSVFDSTVLITGESGVGKERVARALHQGSPRHEKEFVPVNCAALPENLMEAELFGSLRGSFTGAEKDTPGLFQVAHQGTLFLDEVAELPMHLQAKLLRVLQEKEIRPVGGKRSLRVDVRVLCATHQDLQALVKAGKFREDLYYRINVIPIHIPPLRERREDLQVLIPYFMNKLNERWGLQKTITLEVFERLREMPFPGNVRELENILERAYILSPGRELSLRGFQQRAKHTKINLGDEDETQALTLKEIELQYIRKVISQAGTKEEAARILGIGRKTLYRKEQELQDHLRPTPALS
jgi:two-component system response regulator AtoC